jgi:CRP-like cAMP-binding protein
VLGAAGHEHNRVRWTDPGERLLSEGDPADEFFLIRRGAVAVDTEVPGRGAVTLETLGPGEILGWSWLAAYAAPAGGRART